MYLKGAQITYYYNLIMHISSSLCIEISDDRSVHKKLIVYIIYYVVQVFYVQEVILFRPMWKKKISSLLL